MYYSKLTYTIVLLIFFGCYSSGFAQTGQTYESYFTRRSIATISFGYTPMQDKKYSNWLLENGQFPKIHNYTDVRVNTFLVSKKSIAYGLEMDIYWANNNAYPFRLNMGLSFGKFYNKNNKKMILSCTIGYDFTDSGPFYTNILTSIPNSDSTQLTKSGMYISPSIKLFQDLFRESWLVGVDAGIRIYYPSKWRYIQPSNKTNHYPVITGIPQTTLFDFFITIAFGKHDYL